MTTNRPANDAAAVIRGPVLSDWRAAERQLDSLTPQSTEERRRYDLIAEYSRLRDSAFVYLAIAIGSNDPRARQQFMKRDSAANRVKALLSIKDCEGPMTPQA